MGLLIHHDCEAPYCFTCIYTWKHCLHIITVRLLTASLTCNVLCILNLSKLSFRLFILFCISFTVWGTSSWGIIRINCSVWLWCGLFLFFGNFFHFSGPPWAAGFFGNFCFILLTLSGQQGEPRYEGSLGQIAPKKNSAARQSSIAPTQKHFELI